MNTKWKIERDYPDVIAGLQPDYSHYNTSWNCFCEECEERFGKSCATCKEPIPDEILFQLLLLRDEMKDVKLENCLKNLSVGIGEENK